MVEAESYIDKKLLIIIFLKKSESGMPVISKKIEEN